MTIEELNQYHADFCRRKFPDVTNWRGPFRHLRKEVDEALESGNRDEFADILLLLMSAYRLRFPEEEIETLIASAWNKLIECEAREWGPLNNDGFREHIREF